MRKHTCDPAAEISGQDLMAYPVASNAEVVLRILRKYGFAEIDPERWYPLQPLLDALYEIGTHPEAAGSLVSIGVKIAEYGVEPPDLRSARLAQVLEGWDRHLYANVRHGDVGHIVAQKITDTCYRIIHQDVFPDELSYGLAYGFARVHLPLGTNFRVWYENSDHRMDNSDSDKTVICISWESRTAGVAL